MITANVMNKEEILRIKFSIKFSQELACKSKIEFLEFLAQIYLIKNSFVGPICNRNMKQNQKKKN